MVYVLDICIGCTQCVRACPYDVLEIVLWNGYTSQQYASISRSIDRIGCKKCETALSADFLNFRKSIFIMSLYFLYDSNNTVLFRNTVINRLKRARFFLNVGL